MCCADYSNLLQFILDYWQKFFKVDIMRYICKYRVIVVMQSPCILYAPFCLSAEDLKMKHRSTGLNGRFICVEWAKNCSISWRIMV